MENSDNMSDGKDSGYINIQEIRDRVANTILICIAFLGAPLIYF